MYLNNYWSWFQYDEILLVLKIFSFSNSKTQFLRVLNYLFHDSLSSLLILLAWGCRDGVLVFQLRCAVSCFHISCGSENAAIWWCPSWSSIHSASGWRGWLLLLSGCLSFWNLSQWSWRRLPATSAWEDSEIWWTHIGSFGPRKFIPVRPHKPTRPTFLHYFHGYQIWNLRSPLLTDIVVSDASLRPCSRIHCIFWPRHLSDSAICL